MTTFGTPLPDVEYRPRRAAYAVIFNADGNVAVVKGRSGYFLPGGGSLEGESFEETLLREIEEELGQSGRIIAVIGEALQYFAAASDQCHYRMIARFFVAELLGEPSGAGEYEPEWLGQDKLDGAFFHQCHLWAVRQVYDPDDRQ